MDHQPDKMANALVSAAAEQLQGSLAKIRHCLDQLNEEQLWWRPHAAQNSIANLSLHLAGNLRQWIISGIGGTPDTRNRPQEFAERGPIPREELLGDLEQVVESAITVLKETTAEDWLTVRRIQIFEANGVSAAFHSIAHFQGHTQEIISLTRQQLGDSYEFDFVPQSKEQGGE